MWIKLLQGLDKIHDNFMLMFSLAHAASFNVDEYGISSYQQLNKIYLIKSVWRIDCNLNILLILFSFFFPNDA